MRNNEPTGGARRSAGPEHDRAAHGYDETTPGVDRSGTQGTVLDPRMGGDPVTAEDVPAGPTAAPGDGTAGAAGAGPDHGAGSARGAASGDRPFDPGRAYAGTDADRGEMTGVGGVPGGVGVPATDPSRGLTGNATGGMAGGTAASPGSGSAGGIGGSMPSASQMQTVAGGGAIAGAEADVRADAGGTLHGIVGDGPADPTTGAGAGGASPDAPVSSSTGGHGGLGAVRDRVGDTGAPNPVFGDSGMTPGGAGEGAGAGT
jgi:hypothetical protein